MGDPRLRTTCPCGASQGASTVSLKHPRSAHRGANMSINPVHFAHSICDEFLRYIFSAFPLSDPDLAKQARKLLERPSSLDIPLVKGQLVPLSEAFAKGEPVQAMGDRGTLLPVMTTLIGYPSMWLHQQQV